MRYKLKILPDSKRTFEFKFDNKVGSINACDAILSATKSVSLLDELKAVHKDVSAKIKILNTGTCVKHPFEDIYTIPDIIINLVLKEHNMMIEPLIE